MYFTPLLGAMNLGTVPSYQGVREDVLGIAMPADPEAVDEKSGFHGSGSTKEQKKPPSQRLGGAHGACAPMGKIQENYAEFDFPTSGLPSTAVTPSN